MAVIRSINAKGDVRLVFSEAVFEINPHSINNEVLDVQIIDTNNQVKKINYTWICVNMQDTEMQIFLNISDPTKIST